MRQVGHAQLGYRKGLLTPLDFCIFCDYLPFEEDLILDLYNFEFPLPKDDSFCIKFD
jgi:hypothetical protein